MAKGKCESYLHLTNLQHLKALQDSLTNSFIVQPQNRVEFDFYSLYSLYNMYDICH